MDARGAGFVHHIAGQHHGHAHFQHLHGQQQVPFQSGGIHHVNDGLHIVAREFTPGHQFFLGIGGQAVGAGQVHQGHGLAVENKTPLFSVHRDAGIVAHMLAGPGIAVEDRGFAAVGIARQRNAHRSGRSALHFLHRFELSHRTHAQTSPPACPASDPFRRPQSTFLIALIAGTP